MLQDQSQNKIDTMKFLERRLNDFQTMGSVRNSVKIFLFILSIKSHLNLGIKIFIRYGSSSQWTYLSGM